MLLKGWAEDRLKLLSVGNVPRYRDTLAPSLPQNQSSDCSATPMNLDLNLDAPDLELGHDARLPQLTTNNSPARLSFRLIPRYFFVLSPTSEPGAVIDSFSQLYPTLARIVQQHFSLSLPAAATAALPKVPVRQFDTAHFPSLTIHLYRQTQLDDNSPALKEPLNDPERAGRNAPETRSLGSEAGPVSDAIPRWRSHRYRTEPPSSNRSSLKRNVDRLPARLALNDGHSSPTPKKPPAMATRDPGAPILRARRRKSGEEFRAQWQNWRSWQHVCLRVPRDALQ